MAMSSGATPLHLATQNDHLEVVRLLIQLGADMDRAGGETGTTPLHAAAFKGHLGTMFEERFDGVNENLSACIAISSYIKTGRIPHNKRLTPVGLGTCPSNVHPLSLYHFRSCCHRRPLEAILVLLQDECR